LLNGRTGYFGMYHLCGRRRVGKTALVLRFLERNPGIYFLASEAGDLGIFWNLLTRGCAVPA